MAHIMPSVERRESLPIVRGCRRTRASASKNPAWWYGCHEQPPTRFAINSLIYHGFAQVTKATRRVCAELRRQKDLDGP